MILKELFEKVGFDAMVPRLEKLSEKAGHSQLGYFKMAYDELMSITPIIEGYSMRIAMRDFGQGPALMAHDCEGMPWDKCLGDELEIADDVTASEGDIAAQCLWGLTFYGFSREDMSPFDDDHDDLKGKRGKSKFLYEFTAEAGIRWNRRWDEILKDYSIIEDEFNSRYCGEKGRVDYLIELVKKYSGINYRDCTRLVIVVSCPVSARLSKREAEQFRLLLETLGDSSKDMSEMVCKEILEVDCLRLQILGCSPNIHKK